MKSRNSQGKKDNFDTPNTNYLGTRNTAGEDNKSGDMPVSVDNHPDTKSEKEKSK